MAGEIKYAYLDDAPVIFDDDRAFEFVAGKWQRLHLADANCKARLIHSRAEFDSYAAAGGHKIEPLPL